MATDPARIAESIKLGEEIELDLRAYELRRSGQTLKLERIPMELLVLLVQSSGQLVSRDEIIAKVWGPDVFLECDTSINTAVRKIRHALKDDPEQPRYIQTVTGKGYRFIAPVTSVSPPIEQQTASPVAPLAVASAPATAPRSRKPWLAAAAVLLLLLIASIAYVRFHSSGSAPRHTLAVLPFENLTGDPGQEYLSDGLTEEMISQLNDVNPDRLEVIARFSVMHYKNSELQPGQIARELGVEYVLRGTIRRDSDKVRVNATLIRGADQAVLLSRQHDGEIRDLLGLESAIAREIAQEIKVTLPDSTRQRDARREAHDLYLRGRYFWNKRTVDGFQLAINSFKEAIARDPGYAEAFAGLAQTEALVSGYDSLVPPEQEMPKALADAKRALELDDRLADAHVAMAVVAQNYQWDWAAAEREYLRALQLNPNHATAHHWYAEFLALQGRFDESFREIEKARKLDPLSLIIATDRGAILFYAREYDRAIDAFRAVQKLEPDFPRAHVIVGPYASRHMYDEALTDLAEWERSETQPTLWMLATRAYVYGRAGDLKNAERSLQQLQLVDRREQLDPALFFCAYTGMGDKDRAFYWLDKALAAHSSGLTSLKVNPMFDPVRDDPRFQDALKRMHLVQ